MTSRRKIAEPNLGSRCGRRHISVCLIFTQLVLRVRPAAQHTSSGSGSATLPKSRAYPSAHLRLLPLQPGKLGRNRIRSALDSHRFPGSQPAQLPMNALEHAFRYSDYDVSALQSNRSADPHHSRSGSEYPSDSIGVNFPNLGYFGNRVVSFQGVGHGMRHLSFI